MIAAIYARKSTEQNGIADDQKSVARQVEHARAYAEEKGWTVAEEFVFIDDGLSGAEFKTRPGYVRLLNALSPTPPFSALIVSEINSNRSARSVTLSVKMFHVEMCFVTGGWSKDT